MSVYKLKTLASILALCAPLIAATDGQGESVQCTCSSTRCSFTSSSHTNISLAAHTDAPYTHEYGAGISDGMPLLHASPHFTNLPSFQAPSFTP